MCKYFAPLILLVAVNCGPSENSGIRAREQARVDDFRPGDTLRYTIDGSIPDRSSPFVVYGRNQVFVAQTTIFRARLYRPGYLPSEVQQDTVYVRDHPTTQLSYAENK